MVFSMNKTIYTKLSWPIYELEEILDNNPIDNYEDVAIRNAIFLLKMVKQRAGG